MSYRWFSRYVIAAMLVDENKRFLISSFCSSTSNCTLQHCYLCPRRLAANHLLFVSAKVTTERGWEMIPTNRSHTTRARNSSLEGAWIVDSLWRATNIREFPKKKNAVMQCLVAHRVFLENISQNRSLSFVNSLGFATLSNCWRRLVTLV